MRPKRRIGILLFNGVEVLDFAGPYEVFSAARDEANEPYTEVVTIAQGAEVKCYGGLRVLPDATLQNYPEFDVLIVPGGPGARIPDEDYPALLRFLGEWKRPGRLLASVCTGSFMLGRAGFLEERRATTHPNRLEDFAREFTRVKVVKEKLVDEGEVITAGGVSSGLDLALYLLERWYGGEARAREARRLDGPWR